MKITIDEKVCLKHKLSFEEVLMALVYRHTKDPTKVFRNLLKREVLVKQGGTYPVTQRWSDEIDEILADSSGCCQKSDEELLALAKKMRELYPQEKMKDRFGKPTQYYYRCNNSEVMKALKRFFTQFGNYSDEEVLDATRRYVASFQGQYWQKGMRLIKYFILKNPIKQGEDGQGHIEQVSDLLTFIENKGIEEDEVINGDMLANLV